MAKGGLENVERLMRRLDRIPANIRKAGGQEAFMQAEEMAAKMRSIAPRDSTADNDQAVADHIRVEEGRLGDVSYVIIADAKDAEGRPKASRVELGHKAANGVHVPATPFFYTTYRAGKKAATRRIKSAIRRALKKEAAQ